MAGCRVLVVEDDPDIVRLIELILKPAGHTVDVATTLAQGHARLDHVPPPQVVIVDRRLPDGDGLELVRALKARRPEVPVLVLSAAVSALDFRAAHHAGATRVIDKPFEPDALEAAVEALCRQATPEVSPGGDLPGRPPGGPPLSGRPATGLTARHGRPQTARARARPHGSADAQATSDRRGCPRHRPGRPADL
jgi:DNA-binding response OmpR family regulator